MNKIFLILALTVLSVVAISSIVNADQAYSEHLDMGNANVATNSGENINSGYTPFNTSEDNVFKILFVLLMLASVCFISIFSIKCYSNCTQA